MKVATKPAQMHLEHPAQMHLEDPSCAPSMKSAAVAAAVNLVPSLACISAGLGMVRSREDGRASEKPFVLVTLVTLCGMLVTALVWNFFLFTAFPSTYPKGPDGKPIPAQSRTRWNTLAWSLLPSVGSAAVTTLSRMGAHAHHRTREHVQDKRNVTDAMFVAGGLVMSYALGIVTFRFAPGALPKRNGIAQCVGKSSSTSSSSSSSSSSKPSSTSSSSSSSKPSSTSSSSSSSKPSSTSSSSSSSSKSS